MTAISLSSRDDGVVVLTIDQPGSKANVLSPALWSELDEALRRADDMPGVAGLIITSAKPGIFIAGADLNVIRHAKSSHDPAVRALIEQGLKVLELLENFPVPTAAIIDGAALGGGLEVALACDFRVAGPHPKCRFGLPEVGLGLIPGWGGTQRLPRIIGLAAATEMITTGQPLSAEQARDLGLVELLTADSDAELIDKTADLLFHDDFEAARQEKLEPMSAETIARFRLPEIERSAAAQIGLNVILMGASRPMSQAIAIETEAFMAVAGSDESRPLVDAFFQRSGK